LFELMEILNREDRAVLSSHHLGTSILLMLVADGVILINTRTQPIQLDFTNPEYLAKIREILDFARAGNIKYEGLFSFGGFTTSEPIVLDYVVDNASPDTSYRPLVFPP